MDCGARFVSIVNPKILNDVPINYQTVGDDKRQIIVAIRLEATNSCESARKSLLWNARTNLGLENKFIKIFQLSNYVLRAAALSVEIYLSFL